MSILLYIHIFSQSILLSKQICLFYFVNPQEMIWAIKNKIHIQEFKIFYIIYSIVRFHEKRKKLGYWKD